MLFPALGMSMSIWLLMAPLLGLETGFRAELSVAAGCAGVILAPLSVWSGRAGALLVALGIVLGFANFGLMAPLGALANMATCGVAFIVAGLAPQPTVAAQKAVPIRTAPEGDLSVPTTPVRIAA